METHHLGNLNSFPGPWSLIFGSRINLYSPFRVRAMIIRTKSSLSAMFTQENQWLHPSGPMSSQTLLPPSMYPIWGPSPWVECVYLKVSIMYASSLDSSTCRREAGKGLKVFINSKIKFPDFMEVCKT